MLSHRDRVISRSTLSFVLCVLSVRGRDRRERIPPYSPSQLCSGLISIYDTRHPVAQQHKAERDVGAPRWMISDDLRGSAQSPLSPRSLRRMSTQDHFLHSNCHCMYYASTKLMSPLNSTFDWCLSWMTDVYVLVCKMTIELICMCIT